jgi:hypothetical protein
MDKQTLLERIDREARLWDEFLSQIPEAEMEKPGATGEWSFKDVVAHLSAWGRRTQDMLSAARRDQTPTSKFWPAGWDEDSDEDLEKINRWLHDENCDRILRDVLNESREQFRHMRELVRTLSEEALFDANRFEWMEGEPLAAIVEFGHFHDEHEPELRQWIATLPR